MTTHSPRAGIFPYQDIRRLITAGAISAAPAIEDRQIQPASLDLRLGR
ncbi:MAG: 2'-deoxycytidine 5'-triphosphate deaminase, partial [Nitrospira sp.]|nr:2'-deoxycytidine 5'-triphosphate deaminase [Nitrospira sp.]